MWPVGARAVQLFSFPILVLLGGFFTGSKLSKNVNMCLMVLLPIEKIKARLNLTLQIVCSQSSRQT